MKGSRSRACFRVVGPRAVERLVGRGCRPREGRAKGSREGASQSAGRRNRGMAGAGAQQRLHGHVTTGEAGFEMAPTSATQCQIDAGLFRLALISQKGNKLCT